MSNDRPRRFHHFYFSLERAAMQNENLSFEARGMLGYLLSMDDDRKIEITELEQNCDREKVKQILNELIEAGYVTCNNSGEYTVHETRQ